MKIFLSLLIIFVAIPNYYTQNLNNLKYSTKITTVSYFKLNETKKYHVKSSESTKKNSEPSVSENVEHNLYLKVLDSTEKSYKIQLEYNNYNFKKELKDYEKKLYAICEGFKIVYSTDELGQFVKIDNIDEIKAYYQKVKKSIMESFSSKLPKDELAKFEIAFEQMSKIFENDKSIETFFIDDIILLHGIYGQELKLDEEDTYDIEFPTILGDQLPGKAYVTLKKINLSTKLAEIKVEEKPDIKELEKHIAQLMQIFSPPNSEPNTTKFNINYKTNLLYFMRLDSGWMNKVFFTNTVTIEDGQNKTTKSSQKEFTLLN